jgi:hypothetical protein
LSMLITIKYTITRPMLVILNIIKRSWVDILYKEGTPYPHVQGDTAAWTLDCAICKERDRGSVSTPACCCCYAYAYFLPIPILLGICNSNDDRTPTAVIDNNSFRFFGLWEFAHWFYPTIILFVINC